MNNCTPGGRPVSPNPRQSGFTYVEMVVTLAIAALIFAGLAGVVNQALLSADAVTERNQLTRTARFAMQRMLHTVAGSRRLLLPLKDNPATNWPENIREQTIPPSPPVGDSTLATAVLAVNLPWDVDLDGDGVPDADDDRDGLIDEDLPNDNQHDFSPGILLIDDDGDGSVDEGSGWYDDDEDGFDNEDARDGIDNDGDGSVDEDLAADIGNDGCSGICGVDDDDNGFIDDSFSSDDDEDNADFDDPYDPVVYFLRNGALIERMPVPWDTDGISVPDGPVDGRDFVEAVLAANVTRFRVERLDYGGGSETVELTLELTHPRSGERVSLQSLVRLGAAL